MDSGVIGDNLKRCYFLELLVSRSGQNGVLSDAILGFWDNCFSSVIVGGFSSTVILQKTFFYG